MKIAEYVKDLISKNDWVLITKKEANSDIAFLNKELLDVLKLYGLNSKKGLIYFEFKNRANNKSKYCSFTIILGPENNYLRESVYELLKDNSLYSKAKGDLSSKYKTIYSHKILTETQLNKLSVEELCNIIQNWFNQFIEHELHVLCDGIKSAISCVLLEELEELEYDQVEMEAINEAVEESDGISKPEWLGKREKQEMTISSKTGKAIPKRNTKRAADALEYANYSCEYDSSDRTFTRKNGKQYTEPHHLIPISKYRDFEYSVDVMENIVSLCSHCHNLLHYGKVEEKVPLLTKLYNDRNDALKTCGLELTLEQLTSYYK